VILFGKGGLNVYIVYIKYDDMKMKMMISMLMVLVLFVSVQGQEVVRYRINYDIYNSKEVLMRDKVLSYISTLERNFGNYINFVEVSYGADLVIVYNSGLGVYAGMCTDRGDYTLIELHNLGEDVFHHELGHYMGFEHRSSGVMQASVSGFDYLRLTSSDFSEWYNRVSVSGTTYGRVSPDAVLQNQLDARSAAAADWLEMERKEALRWKSSQE